MKDIRQMTGKWLLTNGTVHDPVTEKTEKINLLIVDGKIAKMGGVDTADDAATVVDCSGRIITTGFTDIHTHFREPGREDKETLRTGSMAALAGGFTRVCIMPNTQPVIDSPESVGFLHDRSENLPVTIHVIGAITKGQKGVELAELAEMMNAGVVAFSDDGIPLENGKLLRYAMEYAKMFGVPVINHAEDVHLRGEGLMNEGAMSTRLGLQGNPDISESTMVFRDLSIAEYVGGRIHIPHVSTAKTVGVIRAFRDRGVQVTAEVTPHHLGLTDEKVADYNTNAKVAPPLRSEKDRLALVQALKDGVIDCVATDHAPHTVEEKESDFQHAPCGMIGLESAFGLVNTTLKNEGFSLQQIITALTVNPAKCIGLDTEPISEGKPANLVIIDPAKKWTFTRDHILSRSENSPMLGMEFTGKVTMTIAGKNVLTME